jgi:type VI secretion system lysozyme-like protein
MNKDFVPSVFDRLTDPGLRQSKSALYTQWEYEQTVVRDLSILLNTRRLPPAVLEAMPDDARVRTAVCNFGLPDVSHYSSSHDAKRHEIADEVRRVLLAYEPRLTDVEVEPRELDNSKAEFLNFRIKATLRIPPHFVGEVFFDTVLDLVNSIHQVRHPEAAEAGR